MLESCFQAHQDHEPQRNMEEFDNDQKAQYSRC